MEFLKELGFQWPKVDEVTRFSNHKCLDVRLALYCVLDGCAGEHQFWMRIWGEPGGYGLPNKHQSPELVPCSICGNVVGLSQWMLDEIYLRASRWAKPQLEDWQAESRFERSLWQRLFNQLQPDDPDDVSETLSSYEFDLLRIFREEAGEDFEKFDQLLSGSWAEVIPPLVKYAKSRLFKDYDEWPIFTNHPRWRILLWDEGTETQRLKAAAKFVSEWMRRSRRFFRRTGRLSDNYVVYNWFFNDKLAYIEGEARFILGRFKDWQPYGEHPTRFFRIVRLEQDGDVHYRLETAERI